MRTEFKLAQMLTGVALIALLAGANAGCGSDPEEANASPVSPQLTSAAADANDGATVMGDPAALVEELAGRVELTDEQKTALTTAVTEFKAAMAERRAQGPRQGPPAVDEERPMRTFLVASAEILDPTQTVAWFELLAEKRETMRGQRADGAGYGRGGRGGHGPGAGPRGGQRGDGPGPGPRQGDFGRPDPTERVQDQVDFLTAVLELNETQSTNLLSALTALAEEWQTTREGLERGSQELRDAARAYHETVKEAIASELTEEQAAVADALAELRPAQRGPRRG